MLRLSIQVYRNKARKSYISKFSYVIYHSNNRVMAKLSQRITNVDVFKSKLKDVVDRYKLDLTCYNEFMSIDSYKITIWQVKAFRNCKHIKLKYEDRNTR